MSNDDGVGRLRSANIRTLAVGCTQSLFANRTFAVVAHVIE